MNRVVWLLLFGGFWAMMMFLLFEREIQPYFEYRRPPSYRVMMRDRKEPELTRRKIRFGREEIGESETITEPVPAGGCLIRTRFTMRMQRFVSIKLPDDRVFFSSETRVDGSYRLEGFRMDGRIQGLSAKVEGRRRGDKVVVSYDVLALRGERVVDLPRDAMLADNYLPYMGGARLEVGKKWRMRIVDADELVSLKPEKAVRDLYAMVVSRESLNHAGRDVPVFKVEMRKEASEEIPAYTLWVDDEGAVVRQQRMIRKLPCIIEIEERRALNAAEARDYAWRVPFPEGR